MAHYFSASRTPIQLDLAPDDIGVRFAGETGPRVAAQAAVLVSGGVRRAAPPARRFHRFLMLHDANAAARPVGSIAGALPQRLATRVERPLPVFVERRSQIKLIATEEIVVRFKPKASAATQRKLLAGLELKSCTRAPTTPTPTSSCRRHCGLACARPRQSAGRGR